VIQKEIFEALSPQKMKSWIKEALSKAGIKTVEMLKDDKKIESAANRIYKKIPLIPY